MNITLTELPKEKTLDLEYQFFKTPVGDMLIVSWKKSLVYASFSSNQKKALTEVQTKFPKAKLTKKRNSTQKRILDFFSHPKKILKPISVAVSGTPFQTAVWKALLQVPFGKTVTYSDLARKIRKPLATRAVASAVAKNPFAILIPCHRVVPKGGGVGKYHWGPKNKKSILDWEQGSPKKVK